LHWAMTQFHGTMEVMPCNLAERVYAICMLLVGMLGFSCVVSSITSTIVHTRQCHRQRVDFNQKLRTYFLRHQFEPEVVIAVKGYLETNMAWGQETILNEAEILSPLPLQMQKSLQLQARGPTICKHWLFRSLVRQNVTELRDITYQAFTLRYSRAWHSIFFMGDACKEMFFVETGTCKYVIACGGCVEDSRGFTAVDDLGAGEDSVRTKLQRWGKLLSKTEWICEPALWIKAWQNTGSLFSVDSSALLCVDSDGLSSVLVKFPLVHFDFALYARWVLQALQTWEDRVMDDWAPRESGIWNSETPQNSCRS